MRAALERWLNRVWYGDKTPPLPLRLLAAAYARHLHSQQPAADTPDTLRPPVVVVGNLTAGGGGKTPLVIRLVELARDAGLRPGVISRGYGRRETRPLRAGADSTADQIGDEPLLIHRRLGVPVAVAAKRLEAVEQIADEVDIIIADDGLQHLALPRQREVVVIDGQRRFGNGHLLPAGPLREPLSRLRQVDYVICKNPGTDQTPDAVSGVTEIPMTIRGDRLVALIDERSMPLKALSGQTVIALAGVAHPEPFFTALQTAGLAPQTHAFPDHHHYQLADFDDLPTDLPIIMTEKDAVKIMALGLPESLLKRAWQLPIHATLPAEFEQRISEDMQSLVSESRAGQ